VRVSDRSFRSACDAEPRAEVRVRRPDVIALKLHPSPRHLPRVDAALGDSQPGRSLPTMGGEPTPHSKSNPSFRGPRVPILPPPFDDGTERIL
jgi:hypothetical protein